MNSKQALAPYLFFEGIDYRAYEFLGVHKERGGYAFRVFAPRAEKVFLVGDFNGWAESIRMVKLCDGGVWEAFVDTDTASLGDKYKYKIYGGGTVAYKADPFCTHTTELPETASLLDFDGDYKWRDSGWLNFRKKYAKNYYKLPMNIYELHMGSWKRRNDGSYMDFEELACDLAPYVKQMGYTHIQLMSVLEPSDDGSIALGNCSYFSATAKHGGNEKLKRFVDSMHEAGIGVILPIDLAYFCDSEYGLGRFDGTPLYERSDAEAADGLLPFDLGKNEIKSFLISSVDYWLREFHIDALYIESLLAMLSLGGTEFLDKLTHYIKREFYDVILMADGRDASSARALGIDMVSDPLWTENTLSYASIEPCFRKYNHSKLNFSMTYAFDQNRLLSVSHRDVSCGRLSFIDKMAGDYWQKFANARAYLGYMMTHPGKKLSFMGNEIGQFREWERENETEWFLLEYEAHAKFQRYTAELNHLYLREPALWSEDDSWRGFEWIEPDDASQSIISYKRIASDKSELIVLVNFTPEPRHDFLLGTDKDGQYVEIFNSDDTRFGGSGILNTGVINTTGIPASRCQNSIEIVVPPLATVIFKVK